MVGELRWGLALCGVWEGILIQHATHDVGPTMTAPIPALIFHRFYSRPSPPSSLLLLLLLLLLLPLPLAPPPSLPLPSPLRPAAPVPSRPEPPSPPRPARPCPSACHSYLDTEPRPCHHSNPIFYTVKPVCLSDRPRLISSFQNRNVMGRWGRECRVIDCSLSDLPTCHSPRGNE